MNLSYELAGELKGAGFPQIWPQPDFLALHDAVIVDGIYKKYSEHFDPYRPTLSELIEECGDGFGLLKKTPSGHTVDSRFKWSAISDEQVEEESDEAYPGSTPEEAVARLWLALNKK